MPAEAEHAGIVRAIKTRRPDFVVVERKEARSDGSEETYHYAFPPSEILSPDAAGLHLDVGLSVRDAMAHGPRELHETGASISAEVNKIVVPKSASNPAPHDRTILFRGDKPFAAMPATGDLGGIDLREAWSRSADQQSAKGVI